MGTSCWSQTMKPSLGGFHGHYMRAYRESINRAPDVVVRLPRGGHQRVGERGQRGVRAVPPVRLVLLHAVDVDLVMPCARMQHAADAGPVCYKPVSRDVSLLSTHPQR